MTKTTLLFDLDGTLIDSVPDLAAASNKMLRALGRQEFSEQYYRNWIGNGAKVMVRRALSADLKSADNLQPELIEQALALFLQHYQEGVCINTSMYPDVKSTLEYLKKQGKKLAIVTNKPSIFIAPILKELGLTMFDFFLGGDTLERCKPDPYPLLHACKLSNCSIEDCVMIGDSRNDILAAKAANMDSIGLTYGYNYGEDIRIHQPNIVLNQFSGITDWV